MNRTTRDCLVQLMKKSEDKRKDTEISALLPVLTWKVRCLRGLDKGKMMEMLRLCFFRKYRPDQIIRKEGKPWDKFCIILRGRVTMFTKDTETGIKDIPEPEIDIDADESYPCSPILPPISGPVPKRKYVRFKDQVQERPLDRRKLGRRLDTLESLRSFGELSFMSGDFSGDATVVADEETEVMVVPGRKVAERVKSYEAMESEQKKLFVKTHSFFSKWPEVQQEQVLSILTRSYHPLGTTIVKQGTSVTGLHFLISGRARLSATPSKHKKQYPDLYVQYDDKPNPWNFKKQVYNHLPSYNTARDMHNMAHRMYIKRADGYAAAEKLVYDRNIELCFVEEGEVLLDCEVLLGLETSIFTVIASTPCETYSMNLKSYKKLVIKKNPQTVNLIKILVETKLLGRKSTVPGNKIDLLPLLLYRLRFVKQVHHDLADKNAQGETNTGSIQDNSYNQEVEYGHKTSNKSQACDQSSAEDLVVDWYKRNKAPLLKPVTEGAVYYKDMMQRRTKIREDIRKKYPNETAICKAISRRVKDAILVSIKEGIRADKMMKKDQLSWSKDRAIARWK